MEDHPNARLVRDYLDKMDYSDIVAAGAGLADDVRWHMIGVDEPLVGKDAVLAMFGGGGDFEVSISVHDVVANDDHTIALVQAHATRGGKTLDYRTAEIMHIEDGKVKERWAFSDDTEAIKQFFA
jgi:ketosteroid isomerase-like protein